MNPGETIFYTSDQVVVTNKRVLLKTRSFVTSAIASVTVEEGSGGHRKRNKNAPANLTAWLGGGITLIGLFVGGAGAYATIAAPILAGLFVALGAGGAIAGVYLVVVGLGGGEIGMPAQGFSIKVHTVDRRKFRITGMDCDTAHRIADAISAAAANAG